MSASRGSSTSATCAGRRWRSQSRTASQSSRIGSAKAASADGLRTSSSSESRASPPRALCNRSSKTSRRAVAICTRLTWPRIPPGPSGSLPSRLPMRPWRCARSCSSLHRLVAGSASRRSLVSFSSAAIRRSCAARWASCCVPTVLFNSCRRCSRARSDSSCRTTSLAASTTASSVGAGIPIPLNRVVAAACS